MTEDYLKCEYQNHGLWLYLVINDSVILWSMNTWNNVVKYIAEGPYSVKIVW
jgi:hypothetical protein